MVSKDNGTSWTVNRVPGSTPRDSDPSVGVGSNGTVYFGYFGYVGADGVPGVATSTDQGATWKYNQSVGTEFGIKNAVFPAMVAGDDNRAAFAYLGTLPVATTRTWRRFTASGTCTSPRRTTAVRPG